MSFSYHSDYPMVYDIEYYFTTSSFANRELDETILKFTSGVKEIEWAIIRYSTSPEIVNNVLQVSIFKDSSNYWCLRIKGMDDNLYSSSQRWIIRMRLPQRQHPLLRLLHLQLQRVARSHQL